MFRRSPGVPVMSCCKSTHLKVLGLKQFPQSPSCFGVLFPTSVAPVFSLDGFLKSGVSWVFCSGLTSSYSVSLLPEGSQSPHSYTPTYSKHTPIMWISYVNHRLGFVTAKILHQYQIMTSPYIKPTAATVLSTSFIFCVFIIPKTCMTWHTLPFEVFLNSVPLPTLFQFSPPPFLSSLLGTLLLSCLSLCLQFGPHTLYLAHLHGSEQNP